LAVRPEKDDPSNWGRRVRRLDVAARPAEAGVGQEHLSESVKLTSATSSPLSVIWGGAAVLDGVSAVGTAVATDAARRPRQLAGAESPAPRSLNGARRRAVLRPSLMAAAPTER
jgi:hypothetical protein